MIEALPWEGPVAEWASHSELPHVLLVIDQLPETLGGGERAALKLAANLPKYGFRASILTFSLHPNCAGLRPLPCPIYVLPLKRTYDLTAIRGAFEFKRFLSAHQVRIAHTFFESSDLWAGFVAKTMSDAKLVWSRRDMGILRGRKHAIAYRLMAGMPDAVFAVSEQVRRHCITVDGIDPKRVETVYSGLDLAQWEQRAPPAKRKDGPVVTTVGNIRRVKGHDLLIRAAAKTASKFPGATFSIAGAVLEPDYFAELQAMVSQLDLAGRFHFAGAVTDLQGHLSSADIFVLPSRSEGFSNAIIEAMAAGLPVVATDVGGNAEAVEHGVSGIIVPPESPDALAEAIAELFAHPACAQAMGTAGKAIVAKKFSVGAMMDHIVGVYRRLLAES
jgi:glycosyltransferase involved in cell wall biosynthesis